MVNTMKKALAFFVAIILMMGACGCMSHSEEKKDVALKHVENKYEGSFEIVSYTDKNIDMPYDEFVMKDESGRKFFLYIKENDEGEDVIQDNYYGILKATDYEKTTKKILDKYFSDYKYFFNFTAGYFDNKYDGDFELTDALKDNKRQFFTNNYIFVRKDELLTDESRYDEMTSELKEYGLTMYLAVYPVSDEEFNCIDENNDVDQYLPDDYRVDPAFKKTIK